MLELHSEPAIHQLECGPGQCNPLAAFMSALLGLQVTEPAAFRLPTAKPRPEDCFMPQTWEQLYRLAFQERDAEKASTVCDHARVSINQRLTEIAGCTSALDEKEREQLFEAMRCLFIHENNRRAPN